MIKEYLKSLIIYMSSAVFLVLFAYFNFKIPEEDVIKIILWCIQVLLLKGNFSRSTGVQVYCATSKNIPPNRNFANC